VIVSGSLFSCGEGAKKGPSDTKATAHEAWKRFYRPPTDRIPRAAVTNPGDPWGDYVGSQACAPCHAKAYDEWRDSYHSKTLYDAVPETVFGDFASDATYDDARYAFVVSTWSAGTKRGMRIRRNPAFTGNPDTYGMGLPAEPEGSFEVLYSFGNRRHQPYVVRTAEGRHWVLPVYWNDVVKKWMWCGWRPYVTACASCHVTGIKTREDGAPADHVPMTQPPRFNLPAGKEGWAEGAVGCEVCHGPGRNHVETAQRMGNDAYRAHLAAGGEPTIYDPAKEKDPRVRQSQCDSCHDFFSESTATWVPGPHGYGHAMARHLLTKEDPQNESQFWPDGTNRNVCSMGQVFGTSRMSKKGVECRDCHDAHGTKDWADLVRPLEGNALCLGCHEHAKAFPDAKSIEAHTHHPAAGPGSLCHECHMRRDKRFSNGVTVMSAELHSHDFTTPTGDEPANGPGPSCNFCHTDRDAAWTKSVLRAWRAGTPPPK
jgi:predicted CXXCH cytochrome family protein